VAGWPIFAEWEARKALPQYGGNKIPESYLNAFNARTFAILGKSSGSQTRQASEPDVPSDVARFLKDM
jgi:hypothetical protein